MNTAFFGELLQTIAERGRSLIDRAGPRRGSVARSDGLVELCEGLLSRRGEASGVALARDILVRYAELDAPSRAGFFQGLAEGFGPERARLAAAVRAYEHEPTAAAVTELHAAAEPRRQELFRRLNLAPGGTVALVRMRENVLDALADQPDLAVVDDDFVHLFSSWFNRGFLVLRRIDWSTPAAVLEKIIQYEAVHTIRDWDDLRRRTGPSDRRCYAFFHPALVDEPLIFVEVALTREIPATIGPILSVDREALRADQATTAVFYSISNCQRGLAGVSFGHFLIKQVVEEIRREHPRLATFVTLSPAPGFAAWLDRERRTQGSGALPAEDRVALSALETQDWWRAPTTRDTLREPMLRAAAWYFIHARSRQGTLLDPVARFHLGNGARLERLNWLGDTSERALRQAHGLMVNYLYDLDEIEKNHEAYAETRTVIASGAVRRLVRGPAPSAVSREPGATITPRALPAAGA